MTLNLLKPILSLSSGKYFIEMKEHHSPTRAPPLLPFQEAHLEELFILLISFLFICFISPISFQRTSISLLWVSFFFPPVPLPPEPQLSILWNLDKCVPSPGFVFVSRSVNTKPISSPSQKLYL